MAEVDVISEVWETKHHIFILKDKQTNSSSFERLWLNGTSCKCFYQKKRVFNLPNLTKSINRIICWCYFNLIFLNLASNQEHFQILLRKLGLLKRLKHLKHLKQQQKSENIVTHRLIKCCPLVVKSKITACQTLNSLSYAHMLVNNKIHSLIHIPADRFSIDLLKI